MNCRLDGEGYALIVYGADSRVLGLCASNHEKRRKRDVVHDRSFHNGHILLKGRIRLKKFHYFRYMVNRCLKRKGSGLPNVSETMKFVNSSNSLSLRWTPILNSFLANDGR